MERTIEQTDYSFIETLNNCFNYIIESLCDEASMTDGYMRELTEITIAYHTDSFDTAWNRLINSGIFHDSEGKVVEVGEDFVIVTDEY